MPNTPKGFDVSSETTAAPVIFHDDHTEASQRLTPAVSPDNATLIADARREKCKDITMMIVCGMYCIPNYILTAMHCQLAAAHPLEECGEEIGWEGDRGVGAPKKGLTAACCRLFCAPMKNYDDFNKDRRERNAFIQAHAPVRQGMN